MDRQWEPFLWGDRPYPPSRGFRRTMFTYGQGCSNQYMGNPFLQYPQQSIQGFGQQWNAFMDGGPMTLDMLGVWGIGSTGFGMMPGGEGIGGGASMALVYGEFARRV